MGKKKKEIDVKDLCESLPRRFATLFNPSVASNSTRNPSTPTCARFSEISSCAKGFDFDSAYD